MSVMDTIKVPQIFSSLNGTGKASSKRVFWSTLFSQLLWRLFVAFQAQLLASQAMLWMEKIHAPGA